MNVFFVHLPPEKQKRKQLLLSHLIYEQTDYSAKL